MPRRHPHVVNLDEVEPSPGFPKGKFRSTSRGLARAAGAVQLGCTFYELEPGHTAFPKHWHGGNEEAVVILSGEGRLRIGDDEVAVRAGDYLAFPTGPASAHQLWATGSQPLRYYCFSTMKTPEFVGYPDSKKYGAAVRLDDGKVVRQVFYEEDARGYFDREDDARDE
ncbi:MAG: cupin domain-containing protein [Myxococcota bacterium]